MEWNLFTSNAVREELAKERPVAAGLRSSDEDRWDWWGLTNTFMEVFLQTPRRQLKNSLRQR